MENDINAKKFIKEYTVTNGAIRRIVLVSRIPLSRKDHNMAFVFIKIKTI